MATQRVTRFLSVLLLVPALLASPAAAQSTRTEEIAGQQAEKAKSLGTEGPSDAERIIRQVLLSPLLSGGDGVYPWFGSVYSGTGMGLGVGYLERLQKAAFFNVQAGLSINGSMVLRGTFAAPELWRVVQFNANAQWLEAKGVSYYGFGQDSLKENRETFDFAPKDIGVNATVKPLRNVFVTGSYTFVNFDTTRETPMFPPEQSPGMNEELNFHVTRATGPRSNTTKNPPASPTTSTCRNTRSCSWCPWCGNSSSLPFAVSRRWPIRRGTRRSRSC
jgi:hypothetical protein